MELQMKYNMQVARKDTTLATRLKKITKAVARS
jgi:higA family protein